MTGPWTERIEKVAKAFSDGKTDAAQNQLASYFNTVIKLSKLGGRPPHLDAGWIDACGYLAVVLFEKGDYENGLEALAAMLVAEELRWNLEPSDWRQEPTGPMERLAKACNLREEQVKLVGRLFFVVDNLNRVTSKMAEEEVMRTSWPQWCAATSALFDKLGEEVQAQARSKTVLSDRKSSFRTSVEKTWTSGSWPGVVKEQADSILAWAEKNDVEMRPKKPPGFLTKWLGDKWTGKGRDI